VKRAFILFALVLLVAGSAFAADRAILSGSDLWTTPGDGSTFTDFAFEPIPAGFFCAGSAPFTGQIKFRGVPLASDDPEALGTTDTIVQRLDDAVFNKRGVATTRLQVRALSLQSLGLVKTSCGSFKAVAALAGDQPITSMRIVRDSADGGRFWAPLSLNVKITFTPVGRNAQRGKLELIQNVQFDGSPIAWSSLPGRPDVAKSLFVDTDGDSVPDAEVPSRSNFAAGRPNKAAVLEEAVPAVFVYNHQNPQHRHVATYVAPTSIE
jgi:hypothetical protein